MDLPSKTSRHPVDPHLANIPRRLLPLQEVTTKSSGSSNSMTTQTPASNWVARLCHPIVGVADGVLAVAVGSALRTIPIVAL